MHICTVKNPNKQKKTSASVILLVNKSCIFIHFFKGLHDRYHNSCSQLAVMQARIDQLEAGVSSEGSVSDTLSPVCRTNEANLSVSSVNRIPHDDTDLTRMNRPIMNEKRRYARLLRTDITGRAHQAFPN